MRGSIGFAIFGSLALAASVMLVTLAPSAGAQAGGGTVNGRVVWGSCLGVILPLGPNGSVAPDATTGSPTDSGAAQPSSPDMPVPAPGIVRPGGGIRSVPAGAVLVAVQNTSISARTDEAGRFSLGGVPAGQYFTVAAGPVANATSATAQRPNVLVNGSQSVEVGTLVLGSVAAGGLCRPLAPGMDAAPGADSAPADTSPAPATP